MPKPVVVPQQPIGYNLDPAYFNFGIVNQHSLFLGSAERADVVVDFSAYAGKTLILYNDSPAPVPAGAAPYDFYTGNGNQMDGGGAPNTQPGYGPNTRTIMQIRVAKPVTTPTPDVTLANLEAVFAKTASEAGRLRGIPGPDHHSSGGLQLRLQQHVPDDCCGPVCPDRRYAEDLPAYRRERGSSACRHDAAGDEGDARRDGRRVRHPVRPDERDARTQPPELPQPCPDSLRLGEPAHRSRQGLGGGDPDRGDARRHADLEDLPQRRGYPHHPHPPVPCSAHQPRWPGRADRRARRWTRSSWAGKTPSG